MDLKKGSEPTRGFNWELSRKRVQEAGIAPAGVETPGKACRTNSGFRGGLWTETAVLSDRLVLRAPLGHCCVGPNLTLGGNCGQCGVESFREERALRLHALREGAQETGDLFRPGLQLSARHKTVIFSAG